MKVVLVDGCLDFTKKAYKRFVKLGGIQTDSNNIDFDKPYIIRDSINKKRYTTNFYKDEYRILPQLIQVIEELGDAALYDDSILNNKVYIVEIPDDTEWYIEDNSQWGEFIHEKHKVWDYKGLIQDE